HPGIAPGDDPANEVRSRVADSVELALKTAQGLIIVSHLTDRAKDKWADTLYSEKYACPLHPESSLQDLEPRLFSFNSPYGACTKCSGLGIVLEFDEDLVVPDQEKTISEGAVDAWRAGGKRNNVFYSRLLKKFCKYFKVENSIPFKKLTKTVRRILIHGTTERDAKKFGYKFEGVIPHMQRRWENTDSEFVKQHLHNYLSEAACENCSGARLKPEALHVFLESQWMVYDGSGVELGHPRLFNIQDVTSMTIEHAAQFFENLVLTDEQKQIAAPILKEVQARLGFMMSVGLSYLNLNRTTGTLSGGEGQRIRLASQVGSGLVGCCYVLDEPTIGLHQRDNDRLISTLRHLTDIGNTVLVVEHDEDTIRAADYIIDVGPGPGRHGGTIVAQGSISDLSKCKASLTGKYLTGKLKINVPAKRRELDHKQALTITGAAQNNLKNIDVAFPLGGMLAVTGVSGSGKSTLVNQILLRAVRRELHNSKDKPGKHDKVKNLKHVDRIIEVDQSPIGRTPRSNPATYTGMFDSIRKLFTQTREAKIRGYLPGRFSFNVKGGRCEACQGQGVKKIEMHFLPDVFVQCEACDGTRYNRETLEITYRHKNIADVLHMTVEEAHVFFKNIPDIHRMLTAVNDVGLSYIQLGQSSTTLSGGEAQRVKLASELGKRSTGHTLYILDEPTTGLHFADIAKLMQVFHQLADAGNTVIVIEHNLDVIKNADWVIDLGPEGGDRGGTLVAQGTPEKVAKVKKSFTGQYLKAMLK
ncbi:MAG: excinuclease ABC subunit UvrA, partial [Phycisphaeraceae bacterium]|nr:excinuclease ABC subunit UvrA [Phycisphaeraceae bacterium]